MNNDNVMTTDNTVLTTENIQTQYVDEFGNPIDPSLIDADGNYIGEQVIEYVDEFGNPIDPSLIDESGNYIGPKTEVNEIAQIPTISEQEVKNQLNNATNETLNKKQEISASEHQMDNKELLEGMVTFDYNNVPITDIVNSIILDAINKGASDIHFDPFEEGIKIRVRIDGQLNDYSIVPLFVKKNMITRIKIISGMNITEQRIPQDGAIRTEIANKTIDLRVSCLPTNMGEKLVIRIMDYSMSANGVEALDFTEENLEKVKKMLALPNGIILVTGATGSGKSTTVYSMLQKLNVEGTNLITVEDPIEMNIAGINQVQAQSEIGLTFATVLRSILRQDPDVIMIGEIRDDETARIAVRASITGHLVLSTIHTNNSLNTIERLTDMSVERYLLGTALSGIVSQKLARRLCPECKKLRKTSDYEKKTFKNILNKDIDEIYEPVGCPHCSKGYRGRIAIQEVLLLTQSIKDAVTKGADKQILRKLVYGEQGTETMLQDGLIKVLDGKTSFDEILKLIDLEDDLGSGTQLGLENQMEDSILNNNFNDPSFTSSRKNEESDESLKEILKDLVHEFKKEIHIDNKDKDNELEKENKNEPTNIEINEESINNNVNDNERVPQTLEIKYIPKKYTLNELIDLLVKTQNFISKKKFIIKFRELIEEINNLIDKNYLVKENILNYIEFIKENNEIDDITKEEVLTTLNKTFNIVETIETPKNETIEDIVSSIDEISELDEEIDETYNEIFTSLEDDINDYEVIELEEPDEDEVIELEEPDEDEVIIQEIENEIDDEIEKFEDIENEIENIEESNEEDEEIERLEDDYDELDDFAALDDNIINQLLDGLEDDEQEE